MRSLVLLFMGIGDRIPSILTNLTFWAERRSPCHADEAYKGGRSLSSHQYTRANVY